MNANDPTAHKRWPAPTNRHRQWWAEVRHLTSPPFISLTLNPGATLLSAMWQPDDEQCHCSSSLLGHHGEHPSSPIPPNTPYSDTGQHMARQGQWHHTMTWQGQHNDADEEDESQQWHNQTRNDDEQVTQPNSDTTPTQNDNTTMPHTMTTRRHGPMMTWLGHTHTKTITRVQDPQRTATRAQVSPSLHHPPSLFHPLPFTIPLDHPPSLHHPPSPSPFPSPSPCLYLSIALKEYCDTKTGHYKNESLCKLQDL